MNKLSELYRYFDKHRIYLPNELCKSLEQLIREVQRLVIEFGVYTKYHDGSQNLAAHQAKENAWIGGWEAIKNQVPPARKQLENEFRKLLGAASSPIKQMPVANRY